MTYYERRQWGAAANRGRRRLDPDQVEGIALHWPGTTTRYHTPEGVKAALRSWQRQHMDTDQLAPGGASDIAYQIAIDNRGNTYQLRGLRHRSGANGDQDVNQRFGAFLLVLAEDEQPTQALIDTVRNRVARFRHIFPLGLQVVGHQDIRHDPTACPGAAVERLLKAGVFNPLKNGHHQ